MTERNKQEEDFSFATLRRNENPGGKFQNILTLCVSICIEYTAKVPVNKCQV